MNVYSWNCLVLSLASENYSSYSGLLEVDVTYLRVPLEYPRSFLSCY